MTFTPEVEIDMKELSSATATSVLHTMNLAENSQIYSWWTPT